MEMNKKLLTERDISSKFVIPALTQAGWGLSNQIREEYCLTKGRIVVRGKLFSRGKNKRVDIVLFYKPNLPIAEFDLKKNWWGGPDRKDRKITDHAWKVSAKEIASRNYNLDCKNPYSKTVEHRDPAELMAEYQQISQQLKLAQEKLKSELLACLESRG